jgi:hypothetical protein
VFSLTACIEEVPTKYSLDFEELKDNPSAYTISKGPMDEFVCTMTGVVFTKEVLQNIKDGVEFDLMALGDNPTPTIINVYEEKVEWTDLGQETSINGDVVELKLPLPDGRKAVTLKISKEGETLFFGMIDKELECKFPFKKLG